MDKINQKLQMSREKLKSLPFRRMAPNIVTMLALCAGVTSIRYSIQQDWIKAVICIFIAGVLDGLDGRVARFLKESSKFGAELDSLSDFVSFGVAPAILMYQWSLSSFSKVGWFFCLLMVVGQATRLARFNTMLEEKPQPEYWHNFFVGVPAPAAAAIAMMPCLISFDFPELNWLVRSHVFCSVLLCFVSFLMVSRIPTISLKKMKVPSYMVVPSMLIVALFASFIITQPWLTLGLMVMGYIIFIPVGVVLFMHMKKAHK